MRCVRGVQSSLSRNNRSHGIAVRAYMCMSICAYVRVRARVYVCVIAESRCDSGVSMEITRGCEKPVN